MSSEPRRVVGFAITPFVAGALAFVCFPAFERAGRSSWGGFPADPTDAAVAFAFGTGIVAVVVTVFGAIPTMLWLEKRGPHTLRRTLIGGAALGNAPFALSVLGIVIVQIVTGKMSADVGRLWYGMGGAVRSTILGSFLGVASAFVFWVVAIRDTNIHDAPVVKTGR